MDQERLGQFYQSKVWRSEQHPYLIKQLLSRSGLQRTYTPVELCTEILGKLSEYTNLANSQILVLFNLEFVDTLIRVFRVNPANITYFADSEFEARAARKWYTVECSTELIVWNTENKKIIMPNIKKKFDVVVMNPPYQPPVKEVSGGKESKGSRHVIYPVFIKLAIDLAEHKGYVTAVHPPKWRKPDDDMFPLMKEQNILHLEMYSKKDGIKTFGAMTPYDWYVMQKSEYKGNTKIRCFDGQQEIVDLRDFQFLPHFDLKRVTNLLAKANEPKCDVLFSRSMYGTDRAWMNEKETSKFSHPCVHTTSMNGVCFWYSSKKDGFFGTPKLIFGDGGGDTGICNAVVDENGDYGITQHSIGICFSSKSEGEKMKKALESKEFKRVVNSCQYGGFQIDWRMFKHFRKDFWKDFI